MISKDLNRSSTYQHPIDFFFLFATDSKGINQKQIGCVKSRSYSPICPDELIEFLEEFKTMLTELTKKKLLINQGNAK